MSGLHRHWFTALAASSLLLWAPVRLMAADPVDATKRLESKIKQEQDKDKDKETEIPEESKNLPLPGAGLEKAIDGATYRLGPGDVLALNINGPTTIYQTLPVTLEGQVTIPDIGAIDVNGMTLNEAKAGIQKLVWSIYPRVNVGVSFISLRRFRVHVVGQVKDPGSYLGTAVDRVSDAVQWAGGTLERSDERRIQITNSDTLRATADLFTFLHQGEKDMNPTLVDGDVIDMPCIEDRFSIFGAVNDNISIGYVAGDTFRRALQLAGGFTFEAAVDTIEVARYTKGSNEPHRFLVVSQKGLLPMPGYPMPDVATTGETFTPPAVLLPSGESPSYADFYVEPNDIILVRRVPYIRRHRLVEIDGEVRFPGQYPMQEGVTRLSDVVTWAGGLTDEASLVEATLVRREAIPLKDLEYERLQGVPVADMRQDEYNYFKMKSRMNPGQMVVDFQAALIDKNSEADPLLERGDQIFIPKRKDFVTVLGMVANPGNIRYVSGLRAHDYVSLAGGFSENARRSGARVIGAEGGGWTKLQDAKQMKPGDTIMIPEKPERNWWNVTRETLIFTTQIMAIYIVINNAGK